MTLSPHQQKQDPQGMWMFNSTYWLELGAPWAGVVSNAVEVAQFMQLFLDDGVANGVQVLSPATTRTMISNQTALLPTLDKGSRQANKWGFGWMLASPPWFSGITSQRTFGHWGASGTMA
jgi:CubicO group peptidase (beta-lactamase class C family)